MIQDVGPIRKEGADLLFENPQQIDSGNYTFIVNNTAGEKRQSVWIIVSGTELVTDSSKHPVQSLYNIPPYNID